MILRLLLKGTHAHDVFVFANPNKNVYSARCACCLSFISTRPSEIPRLSRRTLVVKYFQVLVRVNAKHRFHCSDTSVFQINAKTLIQTRAAESVFLPAPSCRIHLWRRHRAVISRLRDLQSVSVLLLDSSRTPPPVERASTI